MKITERSYSTKNYRPKPLIHTEPDGSLLVVLTPWGDPAMATQVLEEVVKYINAAHSDVEVTSAFSVMSSISDETNHLRTSLLIANDSLFRNFNRKNYAVGVEVLVLSRKGNQISWAQIGNPGILVQRSSRKLNLISAGYDLSTEFATTYKLLPPLPSELLGLEKDCVIRCGSFFMEKTDRIILVSSDSVPQSLIVHGVLGSDVNKMTQVVASESPDQPFWIGLVELDN